MKMMPSARQIARISLLPVRVLNIGTFDRLSGNTAFASEIIARYEPAGETDLPSVDFVYQEIAEQDAVDGITELSTLITTINSIRYNINILNQSYMHRYYLTLQSRCELLMQRLEANIHAAGALTQYRQIYRDVIRTEYIPADRGSFDARMSEAAARAGISVTDMRISRMRGRRVSGSDRAGDAWRRRTAYRVSAGSDDRGGAGSGRRTVMENARETDGTERTGYEDGTAPAAGMPMIRDMRFASEWASQSAKQFFWRVQRAPKTQQDIILQSAGAGSLITLSDELRGMSELRFRHFVRDLSQRTTARIAQAADEVAARERLRSAGIVSRDVDADRIAGKIGAEGESSETTDAQGRDTSHYADRAAAAGDEAEDSIGRVILGLLREHRAENPEAASDADVRAYAGATGSDMDDQYPGRAAVLQYLRAYITGEADAQTGDAVRHDFDTDKSAGAARTGHGTEQAGGEGTVGDAGKAMHIPQEDSLLSAALRDTRIVQENQPVVESIARSILDMPQTQWIQFQSELEDLGKEHPGAQELLDVYFQKAEQIHAAGRPDASPADGTGATSSGADGSKESGDKAAGSKVQRDESATSGTSEESGASAATDASAATATSAASDDGIDSTGGAASAPGIYGVSPDMEANIRMSAQKSAFLEMLRDIHTGGTESMLSVERLMLESDIFSGADTGEEMAEIARLESMPELTYRTEQAVSALEDMSPQEWDVFSHQLELRAGQGGRKVRTARTAHEEGGVPSEASQDMLSAVEMILRGAAGDASDVRLEASSSAAADGAVMEVYRASGLAAGAQDGAPGQEDTDVRESAEDIVYRITQDMRGEMDVRRYVYAGERSVYRSPYSRLMLREMSSRAAQNAAAGGTAATGSAGGRTGGAGAGAAGAGGTAGGAGYGTAQTVLEMLRGGRIGMYRRRGGGARTGGTSPDGEGSLQTGAGTDMSAGARTENTGISGDLRTRRTSPGDAYPDVTILRTSSGYDTAGDGAYDDIYDIDRPDSYTYVYPAGAGAEDGIDIARGYTWSRSLTDAYPGGDISYPANGRGYGIAGTYGADGIYTAVYGAEGLYGTDTIYGTGGYGGDEPGSYTPADIVINAPSGRHGTEENDAGRSTVTETVRRVESTVRDIEFVTRTQSTQDQQIRETQTDLTRMLERLDEHQREIDSLKQSERQFAGYADTMTRAAVRGDIMQDIASRLRMERLRSGI